MVLGEPGTAIWFLRSFSAALARLSWFEERPHYFRKLILVGYDMSTLGMPRAAVPILIVL